jgi:hypothetical protein
VVIPLAGDDQVTVDASRCVPDGMPADVEDGKGPAPRLVGNLDSNIVELDRARHGDDGRFLEVRCWYISGMCSLRLTAEMAQKAADMN